MGDFPVFCFVLFCFPGQLRWHDTLGLDGVSYLARSLQLLFQHELVCCLAILQVRRDVTEFSSTRST